MTKELKTTTIMLTVGQWERLRKESFESGGKLSQSEIIRRALNKYWEVEKTEMIKNLVEISYEAYGQEATGYVEEDKIQSYNDNLHDDESTGELKKGLVNISTDEPLVVAEEHIYTQVCKDERLSGGWGAAYPLGGMASVSAPTHTDEDGNFYIQQRW